MYLFHIRIFAVSLLLLVGCSPKSIDISSPKIVSKTMYPKTKSPLLHFLHKTDKHLGKRSAFYSLNVPEDALAARLFLIDHAKMSLNVQYYIYDEDTIGGVFLAHLFKAANRGVKVRILLDDFRTTGKDDALEKIALHPNVELKIFNPNRMRTLFRYLTLAFHPDTLGKRMHNKSLSADGSVSIIGGRNIGDVYFSTEDGMLFIDYDVLCMGKVVSDINNAFDIFWNSNEAVPADKVLGKLRVSYKEIAQSFRHFLENTLKRFNASRLGQKIIHSDFMQKVKKDELLFTVAKDTNFYSDAPSKVDTNKNDDHTHISRQLQGHIQKIQSNLVIISPYFVPTKKMLTLLKHLKKEGVKITVVTNSLASTDVPLVYAGYKKSIKTLLGMGIDLYELKSDSFRKLLRGKKLKKIPEISLHTKMMLLDNKRLAIGSANMDPRSDKLNTELVVIVHSSKLTKAQHNILDKALNSTNFYKLSWEKHPTAVKNITTCGVVWHTLEEGKEKCYYSAPKAGFFRKLGVDIVSLLPIDGLL